MLNKVMIPLFFLVSPLNAKSSMSVWGCHPSGWRENSDAYGFCVEYYDKMVNPRAGGKDAGAKVVEAEVDIQDVHVDHESTQLETKMALTLYWQDQHLNTEGVCLERNQCQTLMRDDIEHLWLPEVINEGSEENMINLDAAKITLLNDTNAEIKFEAVVPSVSLRSYCKMSFELYPFDKQVCKVVLRSQIWTRKDLRLILKKFKYSGSAQRPSPFKMTFEVDSLNQDIVWTNRGRNYSAIEIEIKLKRLMWPYLIAHYVPLTLFTVSSFSSLDLEPNSGNDRIGFLVTLFLVMVSMSVSTTNRTPGANQITFVEWFSFACMLFTFAGLVEYCVILGIIRSDKLKNPDQDEETSKDKQLKAKCAKIDRTFAKIIKALFAVFTLGHWIIAACVYF